MSADRWQRTWDLFHQALDHPAEERPAWLNGACDDDDLREEVAALLAAHEAPGGILDEPVAVGVNTLLETALEDAPAEQPPPDRIGPYEVIRLLGEGGMGSVYLARRADGEIDRMVALKTIRPDLRTPELIRRFRQERQIAATLVHPSIARLLDVGTDTGGQPFLVMEYIEGEPIDRHCDAGQLPLDHRLELFRSVCAAVHFAHQRLVVHRDLKPGNILVGADGVPKLLDFGIAKLLETDVDEDGDATRTAVHLMTPEYASPEQVRGEPVGTASDQYSLGVLLYRLLTGRRPYRTTSSLPHDLARAVCENEPERPSTAARRAAHDDGRAHLPSGLPPERLHRQLRGDLDAIVLRTLRKEPERRYPSVAHLAEDLRLYLEGLPVTARRGSTFYRAAKHVRRHRAAFGAAAAAILLVIAAAITFAVQANRLGRALGQADRERSRAERVSDFLIDVFKVSDPGEARGSTVTAREILDRGAARITEELRDEPEAAAAMMDVMGQVYANLGLYPHAQELLETALAQRQAEPEPDGDDLAASLAHLAAVQHARGNYDDAGASLDKALALREAAHGHDHPLIADTLHAMAVLQHSRGHYQAAEHLYREALAIRRDDPDVPPTVVAQTLVNLAGLLRARGDYAGARPLLEEALASQRQAWAGDHPEIATTLDSLGALDYRAGDLDAAERDYREALAMRERVLGPDHPNVAETLNGLGLVLHARGDVTDAEAMLRRSLALRRSALGDDHPRTTTTLNNLAWLLHDTGRYAEAEPLYRQALEANRRRLGDEHPMVAGNLNNLGLLAVDRGNLDAAEPLYRQALAIIRSQLGPDSPSAAYPLTNLADLFLEGGDLDDAEPLYREALELRRRTLPAGHPEIAGTLVGYGRLLVERGDPSAAEPLLREAVAIRRAASPPVAWQTALAEAELGACLAAEARPDEARPLLEGALEPVVARRGADDRRARRIRALLSTLPPAH